jgi:hypothetical protein
MLKFLFCLIIGHNYKNKECQRCGKQYRMFCAQCAGKADPRCGGGNCTYHCRLQCSVNCAGEWAREKREREEFTDRMLR